MGRKWGVAGVFAALLLAAYLVFIVWTTYQTQVKLQNSLVELLRQDSAKHAVTIEHFIDERKNDLRYLADAREIAVYFENKALGMSMEYGLGSSLVDISSYLKYFMTDRKASGDSIYTRIMMLDTSGRILADTSKSGQSTRSMEGLLAAISPQETRIIVDEHRPDGEIGISLPIIYKSVYSGQLIAFLSTTTLSEGALNSQVQHSSERMDAWETTTHI